QTILFDPESLDIINRSPSIRRRFIDRFLAGYDKEYLVNLSRYNKTISNRNKILSLIKERKSGLNELVFWDINLAEIGVKVLKRRLELFTSIAQILPISQQKVMKEKFDLGINYHSKVVNALDESEESLLINFNKTIEEAKEKDLALGQTTVGPHRDDFSLEINSKDTRNYASRGQQRIAIVALLFCLSEIVFENIGMHPTLLLDDVLSELDIEHSKKVLEALEQIENQVIITATDTAKIGNALLSNYNHIELIS
ncbi:DNA replication and repair protein RecF, partial [Candidatus Dojkabacteria bacterium]|nr:DNA replication and repair protein RecF [Candidatus Dojkabacteria bacterium]